MKRLRIIIAPVVQDQITAQVLHIAEHSIENALAWEQRLRTAILKLGAAHGHAVDEEASLRLGIPVRKLVFERTYLVHYVVDRAEKVVRIVNFRHGARLPASNEP